jgi:hypothetical protein
VAKGQAALGNFVLGWAHDLHDPYGRALIDIRNEANPRGMPSKDATADWAILPMGASMAISMSTD